MPGQDVEDFFKSSSKSAHYRMDFGFKNTGAGVLMRELAAALVPLAEGSTEKLRVPLGDSTAAELAAPHDGAAAAHDGAAAAHEGAAASHDGAEVAQQEDAQQEQQWPQA